MRICAQCGCEDRPVLELDRECLPKTCSPTATEDPATHADTCPRLSHDVVKLMRPAKLVATAKKPDGQLEARWLQDGWSVLRDGRDVFRWKILCRKCVAAVFEREERHKEYLQACKKARGEDDKTYTQLLTEQSFC